MTGELLTIAAAARRLGKSWQWTLDAAQRGDLPGVQLKGRWYVRNLSAFLDGKQTRTSSRDDRTDRTWGADVDLEYFAR